MKEFEKWRNKQKVSNLSGRSYKADARVWKAALEWVLRMFLRGDSFESIVAKIKTEFGIK